MIRQLFKRKGVWLFILAVGWFIAGSFVNKFLDDRNESVAKSTHKSEERFEIKNISNVTIQSDSKCDSYSCTEDISLIFDPTIHEIIAHTESLGISVTAATKEGKFVLSLKKAPKRHYQYGKKLTIRIPASVHTLELENVSDVDISGSFRAPGDELSLAILGDKTTVNIDNFKIEKLKLYAFHDAASKNCECQARFNIGKNATITSLEATLSHGYLDFKAKQMPALSVLNLSDNVEISGRRLFFQNAQINNLTITEPK